MDSRVLIVGAGPAGASAAVSLADRGVTDILLLDRDRFPRDKTCGSGLSPAALHLAEKLGIGEKVRARAHPIEWVRLLTPGAVELVFPGNASVVIMLRKEFDQLLVERARELGVRFQTSFRASELVRDASGRVVGVRSFDGEEYRAPFVLCADGAHSIFSPNHRPKRFISTVMGWWEGANLPTKRLDMIFDRNLSPLYGWMFPETPVRVNIGICVDAQDAHGRPTRNDLRGLFERFLDDHYREVLRGARRLGKLKGHPIVFTTWVTRCTEPGALWVGEAARVTHNATGEGISQAMQSGLFAAEAVSAVVIGRQSEPSAWRHYRWRHRQRFTVGFAAGHLLRALVASGGLDWLARAYRSPKGQRLFERLLASALTGTASQEPPEAYRRLAEAGLTTSRRATGIPLEGELPGVPQEADNISADVAR
jgi:menaquinone-9 beta-reductase